MVFVELTHEMSIGELVVGFGTLALAGFTAWLARRTSAEVRISEQQMRLSRESIEALDRPFLVLTHYFRDPSIGRSCPFRRDASEAFARRQYRYGDSNPGFRTENPAS